MAKGYVGDVVREDGVSRDEVLVQHGIPRLARRAAVLLVRFTCLGYFSLFHRNMFAAASVPNRLGQIPGQRLS